MKFLKKKYIKLFAMLSIAFFTMSFVKTNLVKTKTLTEQFMVNPEAHFKVKNHCGSIEFKSTDEVEAKVEATIQVEGKTEEEIAKVLEQFSLDINVNGTTIDVTTDTNVKSWVQYNSFFYKKNTITFNDGTKAVDITDTDITLVVYLPKVKELSISSKYDDVIFDSFNSDVNAQLFSSNLIGGDIAGYLNVDLKYGEIKVGNIQDGEFEIFDSEISFIDGGNLDIDIKYSEVEFKNVKQLDLVSFDDEIEFDNVEGEMVINAKYTDLSFKNFGDGTCDFFDCDLVAGNGKSLSINSKYTEQKFGDIEELTITSFDDNLSFGKVEKLRVNQSKYSEFNIQKVNEEFLIHSSFDDNFTVISVGESISNIEFESKYTDLKFPIPSQVAYHLDAKLRYCHFDLPKGSNVETKIEDGSSLDLVCKINSPGQSGMKVDIDAYDGTIDIK